MTRPRRILVVSYYFPPDPTGGGNRWATQAKYLRRLGYEVKVVTTATYGNLPEDHELGVHRTGDLAASASLRRLLRRGAPPSAALPATAPPPPALLTETFVPDPHVVSWVPFATRTARRIIRREAIDCVITTSPPESTHLVGALLARGPIGWVADFRDGWGRESTRPPFPRAWQRRLNLQLERRVAQGADAVIAATRPISEDLNARVGVPVSTIRNAWDPDLEMQIPAPNRRPDGSVRIVHTGTLSGAWGRDPKPFLTAFRQVCAEVQNLRLVLVGRLNTDEVRLVEELVPRHSLELVGQVARDEALALQRSADALLLITSRQASEATGKVFEYLSAGRPILALASGNESARIVQETGTGVTIAPDDITAISRALREVASGQLDEEFQPRDLAAYRYPGPARAVAEIVELAIASAGRRQRRHRS